MPKYEDISGQTFGKALAVKRVDDHIKPNGQRVVRYLCVCECGKTFMAAKDNLVRGHTTSCGCARSKNKAPHINYCVFNPTSVDCQVFKCNNCGWNPENTKLRQARIRKLLRKDGTDE